ncbi:MAG: DUF2779 domain-containing protein [Candidatus Woesearchaeota archaeon]|nr:DUF2779 domain-containing protein [Candidatus Woesearchaeota archaeon]
MKPIVLSKSKYMAGLSCSKLLWCQFNAPEMIPAFDDTTQAIMQQGQDVGDWAKKLYPEGVEIERSRKSIELTKELLAKRVPLFEASFAFKNAYCKTDILVPVDSDEWDLIEVKSSTQVKEEHLQDVAFQKYCLEGAGLRIRSTKVMMVNNEYVRDGEIDVHQLLKTEDVTEQVLKILPEVSENLQLMLTVIQGSMPKTEFGVTCKAPKECLVCSKELEDVEVAELYYVGAKAWPLINAGIRKLSELPEEFKLNAKQEIQKTAVITGKPIVNKVAIEKFLQKLVYPLYLFDFETINPAIPLFDSSRPYQQIPFQLSMHLIKSPNVAPEHVEYLHDGTDDPRPAIVQALKAIGASGTVLAYNISFEKRVIEDLEELFPDAEWLHSIVERLQDLLIPFREFAYYHPEQHGSCSIKAVLPALIGTSYEGLDIKEGGMASQEYLRMTFENVSSQEKEQIRKALLTYCGQDTQAMVDLLHALEECA